MALSIATGEWYVREQLSRALPHWLVVGNFKRGSSGVTFTIRTKHPSPDWEIDATLTVDWDNLPIVNYSAMVEQIMHDTLASVAKEWMHNA